MNYKKVFDVYYVCDASKRAVMEWIFFFFLPVHDSLPLGVEG